jgi:hypothetical protein
VMNPLHKLLRKLTPVSTVIMTTIRPCFRPPSSRSRGTREEFPGINGISAVVCKPVGTGEDIKGGFSKGAGKEALLFDGTNSMADNSSDIMI